MVRWVDWVAVKAISLRSSRRRGHRHGRCGRARRALSGAVAELVESAISGLSEAIVDAHLDVRKAAVLSLTRWADETRARDALRVALKDGDADVWAYARRALG